MNPKNQSRLFCLIARNQVSSPSKFCLNIKVPHQDLPFDEKKVEKVCTHMSKIGFKESWFFSKISIYSKILLNFNNFFFRFWTVPQGGILGITKNCGGCSCLADTCNWNSPSYRMAQFWFWISRQNKRRTNFFFRRHSPYGMVNWWPEFRPDRPFSMCGCL